MTSVQIRNLINFTFIFNGVVDDSYFIKCDMGYIWDKYQSMIGFDPKDPIVIDGSSMRLKNEWCQTWNKRFIGLDAKDSVLNYLCDTTMRVVRNLSPCDIVSLFKLHIGNPDKIINIEYKHIHPILIRYIDKYCEVYNREINLELLT